MSTIRICRRCKAPVLHTDTPGYSYCCPSHDEDLYEFETDTVEMSAVLSDKKLMADLLQVLINMQEG